MGPESGNKYCPEHSNVMQCLGRLEATAERNYKSLVLVHQKIDALVKSISNGGIVTAVEKTKSNVIYWVAGVIGLTAIGLFVTAIFELVKKH